MGNLKDELKKDGINIGGNINVYGDFLAPGSRKEVVFKGGTHYHGVPSVSKNNVETESADSKLQQNDDGDNEAEGNEDAVEMVLQELINNGEIKKKQDFGAIKRIIDEMGIYDRFTNRTMVAILKNLQVPTSLMPSESSLKTLSIGNAKHPNWKIEGVDPLEANRIKGLGTSFKDLYQKHISD